jgi:hypothetical protein
MGLGVAELLVFHGELVHGADEGLDVSASVSEFLALLGEAP